MTCRGGAGDLRKTPRPAECAACVPQAFRPELQVGRLWRGAGAELFLGQTQRLIPIGGVRLLAFILRTQAPEGSAGANGVLLATGLRVSVSQSEINFRDIGMGTFRSFQF